MKGKTLLFYALLVYALITFACVYIVLPEGLEGPEVVDAHAGSRVWSGAVIDVGKSDSGDLRIELAIRNDTGDWSTMHGLEGKPARLSTADGKEFNCQNVVVGTGGHRLAPGFQMRGYTTADQQVQPLVVECQGAEVGPGAKLAIEYVCFNGILDDYDPEANRSEGVIELNLDLVVSDLAYPVSTAVDGLILPKESNLTGLSDNVVTLLGIERAPTGLTFTWQNENPTKFPLKTHIGIPPVIGADGIIYGVYETIDMAPVPVTPAKGTMEWRTEVAVPAEVKGLYILLSVESKKPRTYQNYVLDISDH